MVTIKWLRDEMDYCESGLRDAQSLSDTTMDSYWRGRIQSLRLVAGELLGQKDATLRVTILTNEVR